MNIKDLDWDNMTAQEFKKFQQEALNLFEEDCNQSDDYKDEDTGEPSKMSLGAWMEHFESYIEFVIQKDE